MCVAPAFIHTHLLHTHTHTSYVHTHTHTHTCIALRTRALEPLERGSGWEKGAELPETYPTGV